MTTISDLPEELVEQILFRVPMKYLKAVRSTCKKWNGLSKNQIFGQIGKQFVGYMMMNSRVCLLKLDLQGIRNKDSEDSVDISVKEVALLDQLEISQVFHCDGLLLCVLKNNAWLLVWNPYLGQHRLIPPRKSFHSSDRYALGYDKNRNHKILRLYRSGYEIYDFSTDDWRVHYAMFDWEILPHQRGVTLKGNSYFLGLEKNTVSGEVVRMKTEDSLLCFDFTREKFGPRLPLPFDSYLLQTLTLSCVREEQLAVFHFYNSVFSMFEIWVTNSIDSNAVSWRKFLEPVHGSLVNVESGSFFIDEEKKVGVVFDLDYNNNYEEETRYQTAHIIGQDGYFKSVNIGEAPNIAEPRKHSIFGYTLKKYCYPHVCSSYVPSLVQLEFN